MLFKDLLEHTPSELLALVTHLGEKPYRSNQLYQALHQQNVGSLDAITNLSKPLRESLKNAVPFNPVTIEAVFQSRDGTRKYQLKTHDGHTIESVFIPNASSPGRNTICISSQVGCAMGCTFCATASLNLTRNLTAGEIVSQIYAVNHDLRTLGYTPTQDDEEGRLPSKNARLIHNIVYMGMGEPLHNYDNVVQSIGILTEQSGLAYSSRRITVSTSGIVKNLTRLGLETDVHVAISLNATTDAVRNEIMPVNLKWDISDLLVACKAFRLDARRRITFEYVMLAGINDSDDDAMRLVHLLRDMRCKINLIPFNAHPLSSFKRPSDERVAAFQSILQSHHLSVFVRTTRGEDIDAACGMLGAKKLEQARQNLIQIN